MWRRPAELIEPRKRGVEVCLVEDFATVDQVAVDHQEVDRPPLGVESLLRAPMALVGNDSSGTVEPMHRLNVDAEVWREVPNGADGRGHVAGLERCSSPVVDGDPVLRRRDY